MLAVELRLLLVADGRRPVMTMFSEYMRSVVMNRYRMCSGPGSGCGLGWPMTYCSFNGLVYLVRCSVRPSLRLDVFVWGLWPLDLCPWVICSLLICSLFLLIVCSRGCLLPLAWCRRPLCFLFLRVVGRFLCGFSLDAFLTTRRRCVLLCICLLYFALLLGRCVLFRGRRALRCVRRLGRLL